MIYGDLDEALRADPRKKGVCLFCVNERVYVWARSKKDAIAEVATEEGHRASRHQAGAVVGEENGIT